ncbi:MAG: GatB/YqeY domain-containing protein [Candidatus Nomurabacteria bacterium]|jgi:uncharacterized protein YqeY|nr:GatB/YqeY domain-containing protein [Candidatus Nomurabacteria bacterium]
MSLKVELGAGLKQALLAGDKNAVNALRGLKAAILDREVALGVREDGLSDGEIEKIIAKEVKKRKESAEIYRENARLELAENEESEIKVLEKYLPKQLSETELSAVVEEVIVAFGTASIKNMGEIIGLVKAKVGSSADGALVAKLVKDNLR